MISPWVAFLLWVPVSLFVFHHYPVRNALLFNFFGGWAFLPSAHFVPSTAAFPYWILGTCLPANNFFTKASVTAITALLGIALADRSAFRRFQPNLWDLPMAVWCVAPILSTIANADAALLPALRSELYLALVWGVPYLAGRIYFADTSSLCLAAKGVVLAGLAYVPICLVEVFTGPQVYAHLYGYEPYRWTGAQRYLGFRPVGLMEDGNQLGIWMAGAALVSIWLWRYREVKTILRIPLAWISAVLFAVTLLCQSGGSIVLLCVLLFFAFVRKRYLAPLLGMLLLAGIVGAIGLRLSNVVSIRSIVEHNPLAARSAQFLKGIQRGSFGWRLSQDEKHVSTALEKPLLGSAEWDWWRASSSRPWSLWLLAFGMYGLLGLLALESLQLLPIARTFWASRQPGAVEAPELRNALAAAILMSAIDNLLNGSMILPLLIIVGGLSAPGVALARRSATRPEPGRRESRASRRKVHTAVSVPTPGHAHTP